MGIQRVGRGREAGSIGKTYWLMKIPEGILGFRRFGKKTSHQSQTFATGSVGWGSKPGAPGRAKSRYLASTPPAVLIASVSLPLSAFPLCGLWISLFEKAPFWLKKKTTLDRSPVLRLKSCLRPFLISLLSDQRRLRRHACVNVTHLGNIPAPFPHSGLLIVDPSWDNIKLTSLEPYCM